MKFPYGSKRIINNLVHVFILKSYSCVGEEASLEQIEVVAYNKIKSIQV